MSAATTERFPLARRFSTEMSESSRRSMDYVSDVLDEIALEGLDGITLEGLWMRLSVRPHFCFQIDDTSKDFLWKIVMKMSDVTFYEIPELRATMKHCSPTSVDDDLDATLELDEMYPYCKLQNVTGVLGSCQHYSSRVNVTEEVVKMTRKEVEEKWANKLVIVASQDVRLHALMGNFCSPNLDFTKLTVHYDILERIGRSRFMGLATCGKASIQSVVEDSKSVFHYLKFLIHHKIIKKQSLPGNMNMNHNASKVYLTRFFEECLNDNMAIFQIAIEELKTRPNHLMPSDEFTALFDAKKRGRLRKFRKSNIFKKFISVSKSLPYRTFFPNASQSEWERKSKAGERCVRCVKLINPDLELADIFEKDCEMEEEETPSGFLPRGVFYENMPLMAQAYHHIKNSGTSGMSQGELVLKMGLNKRLIRSLIKRLTTEKHCQFYIENDGRRRFKRCIVGENVQTKAAASELVQILSETAPPSSASNSNQTNVNPKEESKPESTTTPGEKLNLSQLQEENMSYRTLRRIGMIIKTIKTNRFRLFSQITKYINDEEIKEGVTSRVDRVTVRRLLQKLESDQLIRMVHLRGRYRLYTDPTFELDETQMENLYHTQSLLTGSDAGKSHGENQMSLETELSPFLLENLNEMKKMMDGIEQKTTDKQSISKESELVYSPKFIRLSVLHDLIFTLVYEYTGVLGKNQEELMEELTKTTAIDEDLRREMPKLYGTQVSPYMFVPPLSHAGKLAGWFFISDILIRMPLSVVVKTVRVSDTCSELWKYLNHPIRKHFLVKDLPLSLRKLFFSRKNHMGYLYNEIKRLCFMGLVQYGQRLGRENYQTLVYLNRKASILNTTTSPPAYYQVPADVKFDVKVYNFETKSDVTKYWMDLFNVCMATNLGVKANMIGKEILSERELSKESMRKYLEPKSVAKALEDDNGNIPGDNLGAGGLDSVMFSFLRSNWTGPINKVKEEIKTKAQPVKIPLQKIRREQVIKRLLLKRNRRRRGIIKSEKTDSLSVSEEKPRSGKLRKVKERECKFKRRRKTTYDEIDLEALKLMNTLRVSWSIAEDNFLLICRVAMMFLCPNSRTFVRIPWSEVRRVLQENIPESKNKTQKAIARRIIYMMKNPTTVRSVNLCLEELREMPEAVDKYDCSDLLTRIKPSAPNLSELQGHLYKKFRDLVTFLKDRFINNPDFNVKADVDLIPDTFEEFLEKYRLEDTEERPISMKNIRENVIRGILMSSLSCRSDKTSSAVQLFDIYRQYNEDELQNAIQRLHGDKVITVTKKVGNPLFKSGKMLPLSFTPYKLSFAFQNMLNMRYAHAIYPESYSQINELQEMADGEEFEVDLNDCNIGLFSLASKGFVFFRTILPDQIIILDSGNFSDATYSKMLERYCEMLKYSGSNSKVLCSSGKIISTSEFEINKDQDVGGGENKRDDDGDEEGEEDDEEERVKSKRLKLDVEAVGRIEAGKKKTDGRDGNKEGNGGDSGPVPDPATSEKESFINKTTRSSRVILYMMREEAKKEANNDSGRKAQELCMVNASKVMGKIDKESLKTYTNERGPKAAAIIVKDILSRSLVPVNLVDEESLVEKVAGNEDMSGIRDVLDFICSKKELGATVRELNDSIDRGVNLCSIMRHLTESKIVIKTGIRETRFVSQKYCTPWLLNSFRLTRLEREKLKPTEVTGVTLEKTGGKDEEGEDVPKKKMKGVVSLEEIKSEDYVSPRCSTDANNKMKILIRPWIRIDGSLNRKVLDRFLGTILTYVMTNPGISIRDITKKFSPQITPVWTKDLVEILFDVGCITLTSLVVVEKAGLFTKSVVEVSDKYTGLEEDDCVAVEAKVDAVTTLGLFIGKKTYSKDFLVG